MLTISRRTEVAAALVAAGSTGVSGESLAAELGISRVAVNKHVAALRALGFRIASAPRAGYRLEETPDLCVPETVAPLLADPLWVSCEGAAQMPSTNDEAKRLARAGAPEGTAVVAAEQTGGRGRFDRSWHSPRGGAYLSAVLRPAGGPASVSPLSLVVGLGAARALGSLGVPVGLKWPNDLEVGGRKLAGVLLEMAAEADRVEWLVAGIGVNVADPEREQAAWVRACAPGADIPEVAALVLDGIAAAYRQWSKAGFESMRAEYVQQLTLIGRTVTVRDAAGNTLAEGVARDVNDAGALLVEAATGAVSVHAGEVTLRS